MLVRIGSHGPFEVESLAAAREKVCCSKVNTDLHDIVRLPFFDAFFGMPEIKKMAFESKALVLETDIASSLAIKLVMPKTKQVSLSIVVDHYGSVKYSERLDMTPEDRAQLAMHIFNWALAHPPVPAAQK